MRPKLPLLSLELKSQPTTSRASSLPQLRSPPLAAPEWSTTQAPVGRTKPWTAYIPTFFTVLCLFIPHISLFKVLFSFYLIHLQSPIQFLVHLLATYTLSFTAISCFLVVVVRDPGPVDGVKAQKIEDALLGYGNEGDVDDEPDDDAVGESISLTEALNKKSPVKGWNGNTDRRWCQKCWSPKPERCHHCTECGRCVLKMDHHCPWLANKCIGFRTYPTFVHLLFSVTCLSLYCFALTIRPIGYYLSMSTTVLETDTTPWHTLFLALMGAIFGMCIGGFWIWHLYLISTNQTTLESLTPYLLLRHIPPPSSHKPSSALASESAETATSPSSSSGASFTLPTFATLTPPSTPPRTSASRHSHDSNSPYYFPPPPPPHVTRTDSSDSTLLNTNTIARLQEHQLSPLQRRRVRYAAGKIRIYDLGGAGRNWAATVLGGDRKRRSWRWWIGLLICGGRAMGDGYTFRLNPKAERQLQRLADQLAEM